MRLPRIDAADVLLAASLAALAAGIGLAALGVAGLVEMAGYGRG